MDDKEEDLPQTYECAEDFSSPATFFHTCHWWIFNYWELLCLSCSFDCCPEIFFYFVDRILSFWNKLVRFLGLCWRSVAAVITPIALLPIILHNDTPSNRCLYVLCLIAIFWMCEALPLPVTSMLPIVLFPALGILDAEKTCFAYMSDENMNFIGGMILALAVQYCNLHKRVALKIITIIGCSQRKLNFGLIVVTMIVSMSVSNSAAISTMVPIIKAVLEGLEDEGLFKLYADSVDGDHVSIHSNYHNDKKPTKITVCYFMGAAYVISIGSCGSVYSSGTNLAFKYIYETRFPGQQINAFSWMAFNIPIMLVNTFVTWVYLQWYFLGMFRPHSKEAKEYELGKEGEQIVKQVIIRRYKELGSISQHEIQVIILFVISFCLGLFRLNYIGFSTGWASSLPMVEDTSVAILVVILLFILPENWNWLRLFKCKTDNLPSLKTKSLITWKYVNRHLPWSLIFLLGGGFALTKCGEATGLLQDLGRNLSYLQGLPHLLLLFLICLVIQITTELVSSVAIAHVVLPILAEIAVNIKVHPLCLMYPAALSCSMGFHTLFGTPHNLIAAEVANISTLDIAMAGFGPSIVSLLTIWLCWPTYGSIIYPEIADFPDWAKP